MGIRSLAAMLKSLPKLDVVAAVLLSAFAVALVSGPPSVKHSGVAAAVMVLLMTAPVAWRRPAPLGAATVLGVGAVLNTTVVGGMVRCGPALPALLLAAYAVGRWTTGPRSLLKAGAAVALLEISAIVQTLTDPQLDAGVMEVMGPMILGLYGVGRLVRSRSRLVIELEDRNEELRRQRDRRADLAVQADRARIAEGLDESLNAQIVEMQAAAATGRLALQGADTTADAHRAFTAIQQRGRDTLNDMRRVVGTLLVPDHAPTSPQPSLSQLDGMLARGGNADVRLHVTGVPTVLPAGLEISAYRTLEHLLDAFAEVPGQHIDVHVDFTIEALSLRVIGPVPSSIDMQSALAAARTRVDAHHGSLASDRHGDRWQTSVTLRLADGAT